MLPKWSTAKTFCHSPFIAFAYQMEGMWATGLQGRLGARTHENRPKVFQQKIRIGFFHSKCYCIRACPRRITSRSFTLILSNKGFLQVEQRRNIQVFLCTWVTESKYEVHIVSPYLKDIWEAFKSRLKPDNLRRQLRGSKLITQVNLLMSSTSSKSWFTHKMGGQCMYYED